MQETWYWPIPRPPPPQQQWGFLSYFSASGRRHASSHQSSLDIKASSVMSKAEGWNLVNFIILGYSTVLMNRGDLGAGGVTDKECGQQQQMDDLVLLINFFPSPLPFHNPSPDFIFESKVLAPAGEGIISTAKPWENAVSGQSTCSARLVAFKQSLAGCSPAPGLVSTGGRVGQPATPPTLSPAPLSTPKGLKIRASAGPVLLSRPRHSRRCEPRWLRK